MIAQPSLRFIYIGKVSHDTAHETSQGSQGKYNGMNTLVNETQIGLALFLLCLPRWSVTCIINIL